MGVQGVVGGACLIVHDARSTGGDRGRGRGGGGFRRRHGASARAVTGQVEGGGRLGLGQVGFALGVC